MFILGLNLTLTSVVFELASNSVANFTQTNLTLTSVVFELCCTFKFIFACSNLTLTSVVFECLTFCQCSYIFYI